MTAPDQLYLEQWPEKVDRDDRVYYEPTGYGVDGDGNTSTITVYVKESLPEQLTQQTARLAFKAWPVEVQRDFLEALHAEHAYSAGAAGVPFPVELVGGPHGLRAEWENGRAHYAEHKAQMDSGQRGEIPLADSSGAVTWDFVEDDLGLEDHQLAARRAIRERILSMSQVDVAAFEGESSGKEGEPYWFAVYLTDGDLGLGVGMIQCASGRPTDQAIIAALSRWHPGPEYRVTKKVYASR